MSTKRPVDPIPEEFASYEEAAAFWDSHSTADYPDAFRPVETVTELRGRHLCSPAAKKARVADLIYREKTVGLSPEEKTELDGYMATEHRLRLAKARARRREPADDFAQEVAAVRSNRELMQFLKERSQETKTYTPGQVRAELGLAIPKPTEQLVYA